MGGGPVRGILRGAPGRATVRRRAHFDEIAQGEIVPLYVAIAEKWAGGSVVAADPRLVIEAARLYGGYGRGIVPGDAISGTADQDGSAMRSTRVQQGESLDQPQFELLVVNHRRIAGAVIGTCAFDFGDARQTAMGPGRSTIRGSREADVGRSAVGKA